VSISLRRSGAPVVAALVSLVCVALIFESAATATQTSALPMPFGVGERLDYRVAWTSFDDAAAVELSVPEKRDLSGWRTWHFRAAIHSVHVRSLFPIDDQFDSYTDVSSLESRRFEMYRNELGKNTTNIFDLVSKGQQTRSPGPAVIVLPGTRDPLGMLFTLRAVDWQRTAEVRVPVYDGHDLYEARAQIEAASESVQVDAGSFTASRIGIRLFKNGAEEASDRFTVWLANNPARLPVQFEAELPFGSIRVEMIASTRGGGGG
jgi:Protein of unknown function (DUF3108)